MTLMAGEKRSREWTTVNAELGPMVYSLAHDVLLSAVAGPLDLQMNQLFVRCVHVSHPKYLGSPLQSTIPDETETIHVQLAPRR